MNRASLTRHQQAAQATAEALNPGSIVWSGTTYAGAVVCAPREVETDKGGRQVLDSIIANIDKTLMPTPPDCGVQVIYQGEAYTVYMTAGTQGTRWKIHAAKFPR